MMWIVIVRLAEFRCPCLGRYLYTYLICRIEWVVQYNVETSSFTCIPLMFIMGITQITVIVVD